ncbi:MAG: MFS transporter, partial [Planctomycetes bacterium]|nr:MFS transporter [Planctomycetota bacterium]
IGIGLGAIGTASRALVGVMTPTAKTAEFFGLWGLSLKGAGAIGPPIYGLAAHAMGQQKAMLLVAGFFVLGLIGMAFVNPTKGRHAAEAYEASHGR